MLELLWVEDAVAAAWPLQLVERISPFGVCARPADPLEAAVPFAAWEYRPSYLPEPLVIHMAAGCPLEEPLWFYLGFGVRPERTPEHSCGFGEVTGARLSSPVGAPSDAMAVMVREKVVTVERGSEHLLELTFDGGGQKRSRDFRPSLPLVFRW